MTNLDYLDFVFKSIHYNTAKLTSCITTMTNPSLICANSSTAKLKSSEEEANEKAAAASGGGSSLHAGLMSPPILLVGTNKNGLTKFSNRNELIRKKFERIREFVSGKIYSNHILEPYFAIDNSLPLSAVSSKENSPRETTTTSGGGEEKADSDPLFSSSSDLELLKRYIQIAALSEPYMGEQQPLKWMNFDKSLEKLKNKGLFYASLSQVF